MSKQQRTRVILPGQYGPLFDDGGPLLFVEATEFFTTRPMHRAKAHLQLSALRHRVNELGDRAEHIQVATLKEALTGRDDLEVIDPPSRSLRTTVRTWGQGTKILPSRGFVTSEEQFAQWAPEQGKRFLMGRFYADVRRRENWLMDGSEPVGGRFSFDEDNREPAPKDSATLGLPEPWWPSEDAIDNQVRETLDTLARSADATFLGEDSPRQFAVTSREAKYALKDFIANRLETFGPYQDAILTEAWPMSHSLLSVPMNLGVLDPRDAIDAALEAYDDGAHLPSVEGFIRQIAGWRDYVWHLYWWLGEDYITENNALNAHKKLPTWWKKLDADAIDAQCLSHSLEGISRNGWLHHIERLMVLGNWALQQGYEPAQLNSWFTDMFVDGTDWVMPANVIGMSQFADGGQLSTKPYAAGGRYIHRMSDHCGSCRFSPTTRVGEKACPFTAGYWAFLHRNEDTLAPNHRMRQQFNQLHKLSDLEALLDQEAQRQHP